MKNNHLIRRICCLVVAAYLSIIIQAITYTFLFSRPEYSRTFEEKIEKVLEKIIPGEYGFLGSCFIFTLTILPFFIVAKRFGKNKAQLFVIPSILGSIFLIILMKLFTVTWAAPEWKDVLSFKLVLCFILPYFSLYLSYELLYRLVIPKAKNRIIL